MAPLESWVSCASGGLHGKSRWMSISHTVDCQLSAMPHLRHRFEHPLEEVAAAHASPRLRPPLPILVLRSALPLEAELLCCQACRRLAQLLVHIVAVAGSDGPQPADLAFCITIRDRERLFEAVRQRLAEPELEGVLGAGRLLPPLVRRCGIVGSSTRVTTRVAALRALR